jgi:hypothetical protein
MAASEDALDLRPVDHDGHRVAAAVVSDDSFELACTCGWSTASPSGVDILDAWADHCLSVGADLDRRVTTSRRRAGE